MFKGASPLLLDVTGEPWDFLALRSAADLALLDHEAALEKAQKTLCQEF